MNTKRILLVGNPNVGKSSLINALASSFLKTGNFGGVTVDKREVRMSYQGQKLVLVDLPGIDSLIEQDLSQDQEIAKTSILNSEYDFIINVVNASSLHKDFTLSVDLLQSNCPMIMALNMIDEANDLGLVIDEQKLSDELGVPCVKVSAVKGIGIDSLLEVMTSFVASGVSIKKHIAYDDFTKEQITSIKSIYDRAEIPTATSLQPSTSAPSATTQFKKQANTLSIKNIIDLLIDEPITLPHLTSHPLIEEIKTQAKTSADKIALHFKRDVLEVFLDAHSAYISGVLGKCLQTAHVQPITLTQKIDKILINNFIGLPIFLFLMWGLFQFTFEVGSIPMDMIDGGIGFASEWVGATLGDNDFSSLIADGIIPGVGAVLLFLPNILILFLGITLLESTGYMARVSFLLDGFFSKFGVHGKSFIPLVSGFGCSVPAYMSARILQNKKDRLVVMFAIGFMSCSARLPVYVLFISAFFATHSAGNVLFVIYVTGFIVSLLVAKFLSSTFFKSETEVFAMPMPSYRLPSVSVLVRAVLSKAYMYLRKAGTYILLATVLIWTLSTYPKDSALQTEYAQKIAQTISETEQNALTNELNQINLENSFLAQIGKATDFLFEPLGFDWRLTVALEAGLAAKEIVVSTLGVLYSLGAEIDETSGSLIEILRANIPFATAVAFIVFVMTYLPCLAASVVFAKEAGEIKYFVYLVVLTTGLAWVLSFIAYRVTLLLGG